MGILKIVLFKRLTRFMCHSVEILNVFNTLTLNRFSGKQKPFPKNQSIYYFLVENTKFKNASFRRKTAIPETNVKTNRMLSIKWTYHKEQSFASNYFFLKFYFSLRTSYEKLIWCSVPRTQMPMFVLNTTDKSRTFNQ